MAHLKKRNTATSVTLKFTKKMVQHCQNLNFKLTIITLEMEHEIIYHVCKAKNPFVVLVYLKKSLFPKPIEDTTYISDMNEFEISFYCF